MLRIRLKRDGIRLKRDVALFGLHACDAGKYCSKNWRKTLKELRPLLARRYFGRISLFFAGGFQEFGEDRFDAFAEFGVGETGPGDAGGDIEGAVEGAAQAVG